MTPPDQPFWSPARTFWAGFLIATTTLIGAAYADRRRTKGPL